MKNELLIARLLGLPIVTFSPADEGGAGGGEGDGASGAGEGTGEGAGTGDGAADTSDGGAGGTGEGDGGGDGSGDKPWYETMEMDADLKTYLIKNGYNSGTQEEALAKALKGEQTATAKLGKGADTLMDKPGKDAPLAEFFKANAEVFGVPDSVDEYDLKIPDDLPDGMPIDEALLTSFKETALAQGLPPALAQTVVDFHVETVKAEMLNLETQAAEAETALNTALKEEWGADYKEKQEGAKRAFQAIAASAGLDAKAQANLAAKMNADMGDAGLLKFFSAMGGAISEDGLAIPGSAGGTVATVEQAKTRKAQIMELIPKTTDPKIKAKLQKERDALNQTLIANNAV